MATTTTSTTTTTTNVLPLPCRGRYVRIQRVSSPPLVDPNNGVFIHVARLRVFASPSPTTAATDVEHVPVNGTVSPPFPSGEFGWRNLLTDDATTFVQTGGGPDEYVEVDLGTVRDVGRVYVRNRSGAGQPAFVPARIVGCELRVLGEARDVVWKAPFTAVTADDEYTFDVDRQLVIVDAYTATPTTPEQTDVQVPTPPDAPWWKPLVTTKNILIGLGILVLILILFFLVLWWRRRRRRRQQEEEEGGDDDEEGDDDDDRGGGGRKKRHAEDDDENDSRGRSSRGGGGGSSRRKHNDDDHHRPGKRGGHDDDEE